MVNIEEFSRENKDITDLCTVLNILVNNADLRDNAVFCELLGRFSGKIQSHLAHEDRSVYVELLNHNDENVNMVAEQFISNTHQLKKILAGYVKRWCHTSGNTAGHAADIDGFVSETKEVFHLVDERISLENNKLFPIFSGQ